MRVLGLLSLLWAASSWADSEIFHGWSKDGSWLVYEQRSGEERVELYFCATDPQVPPSWPAALQSMDREDGPLSCVRFLDPNKAPYQWKNQLLLPSPTTSHSGISIASELSTDGENPGFVLVAGDQRQSCYASGVRESSKLQKSWFHPSARFVGALIDGTFHHCQVTLKAVKGKSKTAPAPAPAKKSRKK